MRVEPGRGGFWSNNYLFGTCIMYGIVEIWREWRWNRGERDVCGCQTSGARGHRNDHKETKVLDGVIVTW